MGPLSGLHINPAVTFVFAARRVFPWTWILPCWMAQFAGAIAAAVFRQVVAGGNYPISKPGGDWRAFVMEIVLATILVSVILHTATGHRRIGHNAASAVGSTGLPVEKETEAAEGDALPI
jgi:aquaporin Z